MVPHTLEQRPETGAPQKGLVLKRSALLFALGASAGYLWLVPVFVPPGTPSLTEGGLSVARFLRVVSVLMIFPLVVGRVLQLPWRERILRYMLWTFVAAPLLSVVNYPNASFVVATLGPFIVGGLSLLCLCALKQDEFTAWVSGVSLAALVFLAVGLSRYGLETTTYYGRPHAAFGFIHPTQSAAAVLMSSIFAVRSIGRLFRKQLRTRKILWAAAAVGVAFLLLLAFSRNTLLVLLLTVVASGYAIVVKRPIPKFLLAIMFLLLPYALFAFAVSGDQRDPLWFVLNEFSSGRFEVQQELMSNMNRETIFTKLVGPSAYSQSSVSAIRGFASSESAYFSLYVNFGLVTLVSFFVFLFTLANRLSRARAPLAYGCLCGVLIFFAIDAQGLTPSNLAVFIFLTYALRKALRQAASELPPGSVAYRGPADYYTSTGHDWSAPQLLQLGKPLNNHV